MAGFEDRKKAQESKFAHDQELVFKATARALRQAVAATETAVLSTKGTLTA